MKYQLRELKKPKEKIVPDQAIEEFCQMLEHWDCKLDLSDEVDKKDRGDFADMVIDAIVYGKISIGEDQLPVIHSSRGDFKFKEPGTVHQIAMDKRKKDHDNSKIVAAICSWCGNQDAAKMLQQEMNLCMALYVLFFA